MNRKNLKRIEFGDFQTPDALALDICRHLHALGVRPDAIIEPSCGKGAFVLAAAQVFDTAHTVLGCDINEAHLGTLRHRLAQHSCAARIQLECLDFFTADWMKRTRALSGRLLVIGNFPWVTNAAQSVIGGANLPEKSNFLGLGGFEAISGASNFDISEWMLLETLRWLEKRGGDIAMLLKTSVARKVLAHAERLHIPIAQARTVAIDAKRHFGAAVDACLLALRVEPHAAPSYDCTVFSGLHEREGKTIGRRHGLAVSDLDVFDACSFLAGKSPQKWRSGVKHDAAAIMEFTRSAAGYTNGLGETVQLEDTCLFPLMKGSDIGSDKAWRNTFVLLTQRAVGADTRPLQTLAPLTWNYLLAHAQRLDARASTVYAKGPRFCIFGVGNYAFRPWRIAICSLYKALRFRLVAPIEGRPVMFDDTVYYLSFETEREARCTLAALENKHARALLSSLIFWDEKRPIKTAILNKLDYSRLPATASAQAVLF